MQHRPQLQALTVPLTPHPLALCRLRCSAAPCWACPTATQTPTWTRCPTRSAARLARTQATATTSQGTAVATAAAVTLSCHLMRARTRATCWSRLSWWRLASAWQPTRLASRRPTVSPRSSQHLQHRRRLMPRRRLVPSGAAARMALPTSVLSRRTSKSSTQWGQRVCHQRQHPQQQQQPPAPGSAMTPPQMAGWRRSGQPTRLHLQPSAWQRCRSHYQAVQTVT